MRAGPCPSLHCPASPLLEKYIFFALPSMNGPLPAELKFRENTGSEARKEKSNKREKFIQARRKCGSLRCLLTCKFHRYRCSRAFLRILSKDGARGLDQTSQQYTEVLSLYSLVFISNRRVFIAQPSYWLINSYPVSGVQIVESATLHYVKACNRL